jgi:hypothetical protein
LEGPGIPAHRTPQEPQEAVLKGVHSAAGVYEKLKHKQLQLAECPKTHANLKFEDKYFVTVIGKF